MNVAHIKYVHARQEEYCIQCNLLNGVTRCYIFYYWCISDHVKMRVFYNVQTTNLTFIGKKEEEEREIQYIVITSCNSK